MTGLVIIGAGGFGREVFALVTAVSPKGHPWVIDGFVDDHPFADDTAGVIHPDATIGPQVRLAEGVVIAAGARLSTNVTAGRHVHIDQNASMGHDVVVLGEYCRLNPQACLSGSVRVGAGAIIGANATVSEGLGVDESTTVGAGAVVTRSVARRTAVKGMPAR